MKTRAQAELQPPLSQVSCLMEASVNLNSAHQRASFLATSSQQDGDWLFVLPITSYGLKLNNEAR